jgi:hypothetical protein
MPTELLDSAASLSCSWYISGERSRCGYVPSTSNGSGRRNPHTSCSSTAHPTTATHPGTPPTPRVCGPVRRPSSAPFMIFCPRRRPALSGHGRRALAPATRDQKRARHSYGRGTAPLRHLPAGGPRRLAPPTSHAQGHISGATVDELARRLQPLASPTPMGMCGGLWRAGRQGLPRPRERGGNRRGGWVSCCPCLGAPGRTRTCGQALRRELCALG